MAETQIQQAIQRALKRQGAWCVKYHVDEYNLAGVPDLLVCYRGRFYALEVKRPGEEATEIQLYVMAQIQKAGGVTAVVTSVEEALRVCCRPGL